MGIKNCNPTKFSRLDADQILTNINKLFTGMLIRGSEVGPPKNTIWSSDRYRRFEKFYISRNI